jgi:hypothetical protein
MFGQGYILVKISLLQRISETLRFIAIEHFHLEARQFRIKSDTQGKYNRKRYLRVY